MLMKQRGFLLILLILTVLLSSTGCGRQPAGNRPGR